MEHERQEKPSNAVNMTSVKSLSNITRIIISRSCKGHVTRGNLSLQLAMQFLPAKISQVAVRMSDVRNLFCDLQ